MQDRQLAIQQLLVEISRLNECGEYRRAYLHSMEALAVCDDAPMPLTDHAGLLILAARSAYYLSLLNESVKFLDEFDGLVRPETGAVFDEGVPPGLSGVTSNLQYEGLLPDLILESCLIRANVLRRFGACREALEFLDEADRLRGSRTPSRLLIEILLARGTCMFRLGGIVEARDALEASLGLAIHDGNVKARARILGMLGLIARCEGLMDKAMDCFDKGRELCSASGDVYGEGVSSLNQSIALYHLGRFTDSEKSAVQARSLFAKAEWHLGVCRAMLVLGNVHRARREYSQASRLYCAAEKKAVENGFEREKAFALCLEGVVSLSRRDLSDGVNLLTKALHIADRIAPEGDLAAEIRRRLGEAFMAWNRTEEGRIYLDRALEIARSSGDVLEEGLILRDISIINSKCEGIAASKKSFVEAIEKIRAGGGLYELARTHLLRAEEILDLERNGSISNLIFGCPGLHNELETADEWHELHGQALKSLMEAGYLFSTMDDELLAYKTDKLTEKLLETKRKYSHLRRHSEREGKVILLKHTEESMIIGEMSGVSEILHRVSREIKAAASFAGSVLITGETGTGKELVARLIHENSCRAGGPFVAVNCAAIPDHLFESEFFGHKKGCFTGASADRCGIFEEAHLGTVFLDEIGELSVLQQVKLLRALQEKKIRRVGDNIERPVDIRIISATNRNLEKMIEDSSLRRDFYYRINTEQIHIEPLRKRPEDIVPILSWRLCVSKGGERDEIRIESEALKRLHRFNWPGNVRELISVADRLGHVSAGGTITFEMLPDPIRRQGDVYDDICLHTAERMVEEDKKMKLNKVMKICRGNKSAAAKWLGISRGTLYKQLKQAGLGHLIR